jgi:hypothetical protein
MTSIPVTQVAAGIFGVYTEMYIGSAELLNRFCQEE